MFLALYFAVLTLVAAFLALQAARLKARERRSFRIYAAGFGVVLGYLLLEFAVTAYHGFSWAGTWYLFDESGKTVHFDPIRGYIMTQQPSRWARITNDKVEFVGWLKGNSQGFATRTDFGPARPDDSTRRIGIFGDSFSAAECIDTNWPDRAQALADASGKKLQLLNFSLEGIGLANWWSIITRLVAPQKYELDGVVFVVWEWDLERKFWVAENDGFAHTWRRCQSWDPQTYPATVEQARRECRYGMLEHAYVLSHNEFEQALNKKRPASIPRSELGPMFAAQVFNYFDRGWLDFSTRGKAPGFEPGQIRLIEDIHQFISSRKLPALVVFLPDRDRLTTSSWKTDGYRADTIAFAQAIGAKFVDGSGAFANLRPADIRKLFFVLEGHWNQAGSDRFAEFMLDLISRSFPDRLQASR